MLPQAVSHLREIGDFVVVASDTVREWYEWCELVYTTLAGVIEPGRLVANIFNAVVLIWAASRRHEWGVGLTDFLDCGVG